MKVLLDFEKLTQIQQEAQNPGRFIYIKDLSGLTSEGIACIKDSIPEGKEILVGRSGCYKRTSYDYNFGPYGYEGGQSLSQTVAHYYNINELISTLEIIEEIENNIDETWSQKEKAVFLWGYLALNFEHKSNKGFSHYCFWKEHCGTCTNFSKALNDLFIRQGVESYCFACDLHVFNMVNVDGKFYPVDSDVSASNKLINGFGRKGYFSLRGICDIFDYVQADIEELNQNYFEDEEIFGILEKVLPSYLEKRKVLLDNLTEECR